MDHTWCDRDTVLPHMIFEILAKFIDNECSPGHVVWYGEHGHKIIPGVNYNCYKDEDINHPDAVYVLDYMKDLRCWFYDTYIKEIDITHDEWYDFHSKHCTVKFESIKKESGNWSKMNFIYDSPENEKQDKELLHAGEEKEKELIQELENKMIEVIKIRDHMWT